MLHAFQVIEARLNRIQEESPGLRDHDDDKHDHDDDNNVRGDR